MDFFQLESGKILEKVNVEYSLSGVPKYDDEGNIVNAVIYSPNRYGGYSILARYHELIKNHNFDKNEYFFISIFSFGVPGSCSPSTTGLKYNFPEYTFNDRINFKKQFLSEKFNIKTILGIIGEGIGGFEVYTWACEYPDDMRFIIVLNSSFKTCSFLYIFAKGIESLIESSDDFYTEGYSSSFSLLSVAMFRFLFAGYFPDTVIGNLSNDEINALMEDYVEDGLFIDIHDFKFRNDCILKYNVEDRLHNIKTKALILAIEGYLFFDCQKEVNYLKNIIKDSKVFTYHSKTKNYYDEDYYTQMGHEIISFLKEFKK